MDNKQSFSIEYIEDAGTKKQDGAKVDSEIKIDTNKYGISKPTRIILRAKITHGKER